MAKKFQHFQQRLSRECGAVCLQMIAQYYGRHFHVERLLALSHQQEEGVSLLGISVAAEAIGMHTVGARLSFRQLLDDVPLPGVAHWEGAHFIVAVEVTDTYVLIADPAADDLIKLPVSKFLQGWTGRADNPAQEGIILLMEPTAAFFNTVADSAPGFVGVGDLLRHFFHYKGLVALIALSVVVSALLLFLFPFLFKTMVDRGVESQNSGLLLTVLLVWLLLYACKVGLDILRQAMLSFIGGRVNLQVLVGFMRKLMKLPVRFFLSRRNEDIVQMLYDNSRIQRFLTVDLVNVVFASLMLILYALVAGLFSIRILVVLVVASAIQVGLMLLFVKKRKKLNYERMEHSAKHFRLLHELLRGIQAIRLNSAELAFRWAWERSEVRLNRLGSRWESNYEHASQLPNVVGEFRNILIIYLALIGVMSGQLSIGALVAVLFVLTQLNAPLQQILNYLIGWQDVKQILSRMNYIRTLPDMDDVGALDVVPQDADIHSDGISFHYDEEDAPWVLRNFDFTIEHGAVNCIVGANGCGKTTLLNLLLNQYKPLEGVIKIGGVPLQDIRQRAWLDRCGVVPQDGHIFSASIARNIAVGDDETDGERLLEAARLAQVLSFVDRFKDGFRTAVGEGGVGLSRGQRQCILIARALYKKADYLFLDEATNDLDAATEKQLLNDIFEAFSGKTILLFASRMMDLPAKTRYIQMPSVACTNIGTSKNTARTALLPEPLGGGDPF